jgi:hypothetical protein
MPALDLFSTSQTKFDFGLSPSPRLKCINHAPYFAYVTEGNHYAVTQGNCHSWSCPRCGIGRAKQEYWRIVNGSLSLVEQGHTLYFLTITTRGAGLSVKEAEGSYLEWTNRLLTNLRTKATRNADYWCYSQVTERQKRRHPHSHILTTFDPHDAIEGVKPGYTTGKDGVKRYGDQKVLRSEILFQAVKSAGLGEQYDLSEVRKPEAVSRYVGKYLFKSSLLTTWPEGWRRVRYSQNWPKTELEKSDAFALIKREDWYNLATCADTITCMGHDCFELVNGIMASYPVRVRERKAK